MGTFITVVKKIEYFLVTSDITCKTCKAIKINSNQETDVVRRDLLLIEKKN